MKDNLTLVVFVLDRSGSMMSVRSDTIGGFNTFLNTQKVLNDAGDDVVMTLAQFDDQYELLCDYAPLKDVCELTNETFVPRGWTALNDAIGRTINVVGAKLASLQENERPSKVIFAILTDGQENSSNEFSHQQVADMIKLQTETYNWEFVYLGANQDAFVVGSSYNIPTSNSQTYASTGVGTRNAFKSLNNGLSRRRTGDSTSSYFDDEDA